MLALTLLNEGVLGAITSRFRNIFLKLVFLCISSFTFLVIHGNLSCLLIISEYCTIVELENYNSQLRAWLLYCFQICPRKLNCGVLKTCHVHGWKATRFKIGLFIGDYCGQLIEYHEGMAIFPDW